MYVSVLLAQRVNDGPNAPSDVVAAYVRRAEVLVAKRGGLSGAPLATSSCGPARRP